MAVTIGTGIRSINVNYEEAPDEFFLVQFNPKDPQFGIKLENFSKNLKERVNNINDFHLGVDGQPLKPENLEVFEELTTVISEELDTVFARPLSHDLFKYCGPFAIVDGEFFLVSFMRAIEPEIKAIMDEGMLEVRKVMDKHTSKYVK